MRSFLSSMGRGAFTGLGAALLVVATSGEAAAQQAGTSGATTPATTTPSKPQKPKPKAKPGAGETPSDAAGAATGSASGTQATPASPPSSTPPLTAPPWGDAVSVEGTLLMPPIGTSASAAASVAAPAPPSSTHEAELEQRLRALEARLDASERPHAEDDDKLWWLRKFRLSGFVQGQLLWQWFNAAASPNATGGVLPQGISSNDTTAVLGGNGTTTNADYFTLRRARLTTEFMPTDYARLVFEIDPTPPNGTYPTTGNTTILRQTEAQGIVHWSHDVTTEFGVGIFKVPFGFEILQYDPDRPFLERSWGTRNMFPGEFDTGARASTSALNHRLTFQAAVVNGVMEGEPTFSLLPDLNKGKDLVGRFNYNFGPLDAGVSGYYGQGQIVDNVGLRFKQFPRWAANLELALHHTFLKNIGETRLFAEGTLGQDMDRGVFYAYALPAFPTDVVNGNVQNLHERSTWVRLEQDFSDWFSLGLRYDFYTPDTSQENDGRNTYGAVAVLHFTKGLQYMLEFDYAIDNTHAPGASPPSQHIMQLSNALQARF
jgi:hypothetical protein